MARARFLPLLLAVPLAAPARAQDEVPTLREQVVDSMRVVRSRRATFEEKVPAMEVLLGLGVEGPSALADELSRELKSLRKARLGHEAHLRREFTRVAQQLGRERVGRRNQAEIERLREVVLGGPVTRAAIQSEKDPAVRRLRELLVVRVNHVWDADEELIEEYGSVLDSFDLELDLYDFWLDARQALEDHPQGARFLRRIDELPDPLGEDEALTLWFEQQARLALAMSAGDRKVLLANAADLEELDPKEGDGVAHLNDLRLLLGLNALRVDVKLCAASRDHSKDMVELGFFSHGSPVEGKETPWKRAARAGTSAGAENIAAGAAEGEDAIRMWWYSPGHHRNMLGGHRRIGLGRHESHWTQMFGG